MKETLSDKIIYVRTLDKRRGGDCCFIGDVKESIKKLQEHLEKMPNRSFNLLKVEEIFGDKLTKEQEQDK